MTVKTAEQKQQTFVDFYNESVDPFKDLDSLPGTLQHNPPSARWLNFCGLGKKGKTITALKLMKHNRVAYLDYEEGTKPYGAKAFHIANHAGTNVTMKYLKENKDKLDLDILIVDPLDIMFKFLLDDIQRRANYVDLKDFKPTGNAKAVNGWNLLYDGFNRFLADCFSMATLFISISHFKLNVISKDETRQLGVPDLDFVGQAKAIVQNGADAHLFFDIDKTDNKSDIVINPSNTNDFFLDTFGSRGGILTQLHDGAKTSDQLVEFITDMVQQKRKQRDGS